MISVRILKKDNQYRAFACSGHAGYAKAGEDIVCAAVSALTINTVNSIRKFTKDPLNVEEKPDGGYLKLVLPQRLSPEADVLMKSLVLGLSMIEKEYGEGFLKVQIKKTD